MAVQTKSVDATIFGIVAYEGAGCDEAATRLKVKRKLGRMKVKYDQGRVDLLRALHGSLKTEINDYKASRYYIGPSGKVADLRDFNHAQLRNDYANAYPEIAPTDLDWMINFSIYIWHLR